jgi:hypothetical protein
MSIIPSYFVLWRYIKPSFPHYYNNISKQLTKVFGFLELDLHHLVTEINMSLLGEATVHKFEKVCFKTSRASLTSVFFIKVNIFQT